MSERELEVLQWIAQGHTNPEIAARLYLSLNTVKAHTRNIYGKLGVHSRTQAVARAQRQHQVGRANGRFAGFLPGALSLLQQPPRHRRPIIRFVRRALAGGQFRVILAAGRNRATVMTISFLVLGIFSAERMVPTRRSILEKSS